MIHKEHESALMGISAVARTHVFEFIFNRSTAGVHCTYIKQSFLLNIYITAVTTCTACINI